MRQNFKQSQSLVKVKYFQVRPVEIEINVGENTFKWQVVKIFTT